MKGLFRYSFPLVPHRTEHGVSPAKNRGILESRVKKTGLGTLRIAESEIALRRRGNFPIRPEWERRHSIFPRNHQGTIVSFSEKLRERNDGSGFFRTRKNLVDYRK